MLEPLRGRDKFGHAAGQDVYFRKPGVAALLGPGDKRRPPGFFAFSGQRGLAVFGLPEPQGASFQLHGFFQQPGAAQGFGPAQGQNSAARGPGPHVYFLWPQRRALPVEAGNGKAPFPAFAVQQVHYVTGSGTQHFHQMGVLRAGQIKGLPPISGSQIKRANVAHLATPDYDSLRRAVPSL